MPGWFDDWVIVERERLRQIRLHALDALCERLIEARRWAQAVQVALADVDGEPLRESAQRMLIIAHLGVGNVSEAVRQLARYRRLLGDELHLEPSFDLERLVASATRAAEA